MKILPKLDSNSTVTKGTDNYRSRRRAAQIAAGLCVRCTSKASPGRTLCDYHRGEYQKDAQKRKEQIAAYKRSIRATEAARKRNPASRERRNVLRRARKQSDIAWAMADRLRKRIGRAIRDYAPGMKVRQTAEYIGCAMDELMRHIESRFLPGMTWENRSLWHVDHVVACKKFDLTDPEQQRACFHYTNLQPLWAADNIRKHAR